MHLVKNRTGELLAIRAIRLGVWRVAALLAIAFCLVTYVAQAQSLLPERRKDQFPRVPSYVILPLPYSLPGIGSGVFLTAYESNQFNLYHTAYAVFITGDAEGTELGFSQLELMHERLLLDANWESLSKVQVNNYTVRGMGSGKNDFNLLEYSKVEDWSSQLTMTSHDRRMEFGLAPEQQEVHLARVRNADGHVIASFSPAVKSFSTSAQASLLLDGTDDYFDPRRGMRLNTMYQDTPRQTSADPDFYTVNFDLSVYIPVGHQSTLAFDAFQSDAYVRRHGDINPTSVQQANNLNCAPGDAVCTASQASVVNNTIAANTNGSSASLGGRNRLRAYPEGRFQGAHTAYASVEFRANLTDEFTPFNYLFLTGVRTSVQVAPFYETGSVSETWGGLGSVQRDDYGVGLRVVTGAGTVYRIDVANSNEGSNLTIFIRYPW